MIMNLWKLKRQTIKLLGFKHGWLYRGKAATHVSISHREAGLVDGLFEHQVDDPFEPLLRVDGEIRHLLHQLVELLRRQLVQDASYLSKELL